MESDIDKLTDYMILTKPFLHTSLSPALLHLQDVNKSIVVIIDVLRATSTIATALYNGAKYIIPTDSIMECIRLGKQVKGITAGERDGKVAEGLEYGNSPFEYPASFVKNKILVLTTTNGTKLLQLALDKRASTIITGSFPNISAVCNYLIAQNQPVMLACAGWNDRINIEDTFFAEAVINSIKEHFNIRLSKHRSPTNFFTSLFAALIAYQIKPSKPFIFYP